jgi:hypothetical protein
MGILVGKQNIDIYKLGLLKKLKCKGIIRREEKRIRIRSRRMESGKKEVREGVESKRGVRRLS